MALREPVGEALRGSGTLGAGGGAGGDAGFWAAVGVVVGGLGEGGGVLGLREVEWVPRLVHCCGSGRGAGELEWCEGDGLRNGDGGADDLGWR